MADEGLCPRWDFRTRCATQEPNLQRILTLPLRLQPPGVFLFPLPCVQWIFCPNFKEG